MCHESTLCYFAQHEYLYSNMRFIYNIYITNNEEVALVKHILKMSHFFGMVAVH